MLTSIKPPSPIDHAASARRGFTLIELLVSISIIALLIGLLFPALAAARNAGRSTQCLANLRSLGQGARMYMDTENRGVYPFVLPLLPPGSGDFDGDGGGDDLFNNDNDESLLSILAGYIDAPQPSRDPAFTTEDDTQWNVEFPYRCPSDTGFADAQNADDVVPVYRRWGTSYSYEPGVIMAFAGAIVPPEQQSSLARDITQINQRFADRNEEYPFLADGAGFHPRRGESGRQVLFISDGRVEPLDPKNDPVEIGEAFVIEVVTRAGLPGFP